MKARTRVAAAILAFAALPLGLVNWASLRERQIDAAAYADRVVLGNAQELAELLERTRTRWLDIVRADARLPGLSEMLDPKSPDDVIRRGRFLEALAGRDAINIHSVALVNMNGLVVDDSRAIQRGTDESLEPWILRTLATGQPQLIGPYQSPKEESASLYAAAMVRDRAEERRGVLRFRIAAAALDQVMGSALVASPGLSASLFDESGALLAAVGPLAATPLTDSSIVDDASIEPFTLRDERVSIAPVKNTGWRVVVRQPASLWAAPQRTLQRDWLIETALLFGMLLAAAFWLGGRIAEPLSRFRDVAVRLARGDYSPVRAGTGPDEARQLGRALDGLANRLTETVGSLESELQERRRAQEALRASREQYLALVERLPGAVYRCRSEPGWPMDYLSPQIQKLTGYTAAELLAGDGTGFSALVLDDDVPLTLAIGEAALREGRNFELRYRIRHADGRIRWIWELGNVERDSHGRASELTGVFFDITAQQTTEQAMNLLRGHIDAQVGGDYFAALATGLARVLDVDHVMIGRFLGDPPTDLDTLALSRRDGGSDHLRFNIAGTPAGEVLVAGRLDAEDALQERYPADLDLAERKSRSYAGRRLDDRDGRPIGVLAVIDSKPRRENDEGVGLIDLFQARVAAELERVIAQEELQILAETLENRVTERTSELEAANVSLSEAMLQLVQREKMASLGNLVAGIAHELNTPIGNALTVATALSDLQTEVGLALDTGSLKRSTLERYIAENNDAARLIERNIQRAAELIRQFKQVAVDQASMRRRGFNLDELVRDVLATISPLLRRTPHQVEVEIPTDITLDSYPGPLEQVLTNLIENSLIHGFPKGATGRIRISAQQTGERVQLRYADNGVGIPPMLQHRVFDPFYTTKMGQGGSGLGLYLVYTLVHGPLGGTIQLDESPPRGTTFAMDLPTHARNIDEDAER